MDITDIRTIYGARTPGVIGKHRFYSVLVPFCISDDGTLSLVYEVRSANVRQPGEVCFPGGHMEDNETPEECAVRETCEELGICEKDIEIIGQGDTLIGGGNFTLYTFIGEIDRKAYESSCPDPEEVKETFTLPLSTLLETKPEHYHESMRPVIEQGFPYEKVGIGEDYPWRTPSADIPVYDIDDRIIWGLTARITENVMGTIESYCTDQE